MSAFVVDLGGTWLRTAVFDSARRGLSARVQQPTPDDPARCRDLIEAAWRQAGGPPQIGMAAAPTLDGDGVVRGWANRPAYVGHSLLSLALRAGAHVATLDDGLAAALAAAGAIGDCGIVLTLSVGTGIGGGVVIDGRPLVGASGRAMAVGHIRLAEAIGQRCVCGSDGCVQAIASGRGIAAAMAAGLCETAALDRAGEAIRSLVTILAGIFDPGLVVLAGGLGLGALRGRLVAPGFVPTLRPHADGEDAGLIGAGIRVAVGKEYNYR